MLNSSKISKMCLFMILPITHNGLKVGVEEWHGHGLHYQNMSFIVELAHNHGHQL